MASLRRALPARTRRRQLAPTSPPATAPRRLGGCRGCSSSAASAASAARSALFFYNDVYEVQLPEGHRFPMEKYRLVRELLQRRHAAELGVAFAVAPLATLDELATTHDRDYARRYLSDEFTPRENRVVGFPWSTQSVDRSLSSVGGTLAAARAACATLLQQQQQRRQGAAVPSGPVVTGHIAGGTHHAFAAHGEGFCVFSDIAVAANVCLREHADWLERVLIVDLDVHQGNGNAVLFQVRTKHARTTATAYRVHGMRSNVLHSAAQCDGPSHVQRHYARC